MEKTLIIWLLSYSCQFFLLATLSEDAMLQMLEDGTRDVCNSRKTVPQKIAELVWERYKIRENKLVRV